MGILPTVPSWSKGHLMSQPMRTDNEKACRMPSLQHSHGKGPASLSLVRRRHPYGCGTILLASIAVARDTGHPALNPL